MKLILDGNVLDDVLSVACAVKHLTGLSILYSGALNRALKYAVKGGNTKIGHEFLSRNPFISNSYVPKQIKCPAETYIGDSTWAMLKEDSLAKMPKSKHISLVASRKRNFPGHKLRHRVVDRFRKHLDVMDNGYVRFKNKADAHLPYRYSIVIENDRHENFYTEKLSDCLRCGCVAVYWGPTNVNQVFDMGSIIPWSNMDDLAKILPALTPKDYASRANAIQNNIYLSQGRATLNTNIALHTFIMWRLYCRDQNKMSASDSKHLWLTPRNNSTYTQWTSFCKGYTGDLSLLRHSRHKIVHQVFDHVTPANANQYIEGAKVLPPDMHKTAVTALKAWDAVTGGKPVKAGLSLTATKYLGTLGKLWKEFGEDLYSIDQWYEIGGGFGGFAAMICACFAMTLKSCTVYDLSEVAVLQNRVFKRLSLAKATAVPYTDPLTFLPDATPVEHRDASLSKTIVVSEHAWSECPEHVRHVYARDVFSACNYGFLTNNFGRFTSSTRENTVKVLTSIGKTWRESACPTSHSSYTLVWS